MSSIAQLVGQLAQVTDSQLREPANNQQIATLRSAYDAVPASLVEMLSFANGEADSSFKSNGIVAFEAFIGAEGIACETDFATAHSVYDGMNEFVSCPRINKSADWHRGLIPISFGYDAHCVCIDMNPESQGTVGQILALQPVAGGISVVANGLEELLQTTLNIYQEKEFDFSDPDCPNLTLEDFVQSAFVRLRLFVFTVSVNLKQDGLRKKRQFRVHDPAVCVPPKVRLFDHPYSSGLIVGDSPSRFGFARS